ncbi:hypothetical protein PV327_011462 [Microctonus hyperodae]|uniref:Uncharacterized protein n=1 Tax=Microctonus hyperodae TaxID=165561 RepID=A0AA39C408_MICHY|nr:hypothetical protein PV327_011462 [Microctonus hyperodae]
MPKFRNRCCNPMNLEKHFIRKSLRKISESLALRYNLSTEERICLACYKKLLHPKSGDFSDNSDTETPECSENEQDVISEPIDLHSSQASTLTVKLLNFVWLIEPTTSFGISPIQQSTSSLSELSLDVTISSINEALSLLNQSPIPTRKMNMNTYLNSKVTRVARNLRKALGVENDLNNEFCNANAAEIISQLREKFNDNTSRSSRVQILTLMPSTNMNNEMILATGDMKK